MIPDTFTPDSLRALADQAEQKYEALRAQFPPGTVHDGRNRAYTTLHKARIAAQWMEKHGHQHLRYVGDFGSLALQRGDEVAVRKGALIFSTAPNWPREGKPSSRIQRIKIHSVDRGFVPVYQPDETCDQLRQPRVEWVGAGGYWKWTDANNV